MALENRHMCWEEAGPIDTEPVEDLRTGVRDLWADMAEHQKSDQTHSIGGLFHMDRRHLISQASRTVTASSRNLKVAVVDLVAAVLEPVKDGAHT